MKTCVRAVAVLGGAAMAGSVLGQTWTYIPNFTRYDASADGSVIVGIATGGSARWTRDGGLQVFGGEPGFGSSNTAQAVSRDGTAIFGSSRRSSGRYQMYRWTGPGTFQGLGNAVNATNIEVEAANQDGTVVVGTVSAGQGAVYEGFVWTPQGGIQPIPGLGGFSRAKGVSADGRVVVGSGLDGSFNTIAYAWSASSGFTRLPALNGTFCEAEDVTADGQTVVGISESGIGGRATIWTNGTPRSLGVLENFVDSRAISVSDDGSIVTGYCIVVNGPVGPDDQFVWTEAWGMLGVTEFLGRYGIDAPAGMYLGNVKVTADGRTLYGSGYFGPGSSGTFVATIPSPGSLIVVFGLSMAARRRR